MNILIATVALLGAASAGILGHHALPEETFGEPHGGYHGSIYAERPGSEGKVRGSIPRGAFFKASKLLDAASAGILGHHVVFEQTFGGSRGGYHGSRRTEGRLSEGNAHESILKEAFFKTSTPSFVKHPVLLYITKPVRSVAYVTKPIVTVLGSTLIHKNRDGTVTEEGKIIKTHHVW